MTLNQSFLLSADELPIWFKYPQAFERIVEQKLINITPWHIMTSEDVKVRYKGLSKRYPSRQLFPFAYRQDNDNVACWEAGEGEKVFVIYDFASPGWEDSRDNFDGVWSWLRSAVEDTIDWD